VSRAALPRKADLHIATWLSLYYHRLYIGGSIYSS
jgi:hypothetical protein